jgi:hypothetical protein
MHAILTTKFPSEKGALAAVIIWRTVMLQLFLLGRIILAGEFALPEIFAGTLLISVSGLLLWLWFGTRYEIRREELHYSSGPLKGSIPVAQIHRITKNKTLWSGLKPALGQRGLIIQYNRYDEIYISPANKEAFIAQLRRINPEIQIIE